jgi:hypothetical protein
LDGSLFSLFALSMGCGIGVLVVIVAAALCGIRCLYGLIRRNAVARLKLSTLYKYSWLARIL